MTDQQMLELAAKAAGLVLDPGTHRISGTMQVWRPRDDDGDAFRLLVGLGLIVNVWRESFRVWVGKDSSDNCDGVTEEVTIGTDFEEATRRAVFRAAAEIGKDMP